MLQGVSFLEVKNQLMLDYLTNLTLLMQAKLHGKSIEGHVAIPNLVEIRTVSFEFDCPLGFTSQHTQDQC